MRARLRSGGAAAAALAFACAPGGPGGSTDGGADAGGASDGGGSAPRFEHYIRRDPFPRLVLEVDAVASVRPRAGVKTDLVERLAALLDKPGGMAVTEDGTLASRGTDHAWSFAELDALADDTFDLAVPADTIKMHVMFLDGHSDGDTQNGRVLGLAWSHTHIALFKQTLEETCASAGVSVLFREPLCAEAELGVWTHEAGHLLGLVDNGLAMAANHRDPDSAHGPHDASDACVMYWAYEGSALVDALVPIFTGGGANGPGFDTACVNDIAAVRDRP